MIEKKKKVTFPELSYQTVKLGTQDITVQPYISDIDQRTLVQIYLNELFSNNGDNIYSVLNAENALILSIIELCTDIMGTELINDKETALFNLNDIFNNTKFIKEVFSKIENYDDFRSGLYRTVEMKMEQNRINVALGSKLEDLYNKITDFIDGLSDISPEKIEGIKDMLKEIQSSEILKELSPLLKKSEGKSE